VTETHRGLKKNPPEPSRWAVMKAGGQRGVVFGPRRAKLPRVAIAFRWPPGPLAQRGAAAAPLPRRWAPIWFLQKPAGMARLTKEVFRKGEVFRGFHGNFHPRWSRTVLGDEAFLEFKQSKRFSKSSFRANGGSHRGRRFGRRIAGGPPPPKKRGSTRGASVGKIRAQKNKQNYGPRSRLPGP